MSTTLLRSLATFAAAMLLSGCQDGLLHQPAPAGPAHVRIGTSLQGNAGAFDKTNRIWLRFSSGDETRLEGEFPFTPAAESRIPVNVPLNETTEPFTLEIELRQGASAIFAGAESITLTLGRTAEAEIDLVPVVASVQCGGEPVVLSSYGETVQLVGAAVFATGDTIDDVTPVWSTNHGNIATVTPLGLATAVSDGDATMQCTVGPASDTRIVRVSVAVRNLTVAPDTATIMLGATAVFTATLSDALGNAITGRSVTWTSRNTAVATVNSATGVTTGVAAGTTHVIARHGDLSDSAAVTVIRPPTVQTLAATGVQSTQAVLRGSVNPNGTATQARFLWGTSATLAGAGSTPLVSMGSGTANDPLSASLTGLQPGTTYYFRVVGTSAAGTAQGDILSFRTLLTPLVTTVGVSGVRGVFTLQGSVNPRGTATQAWFQWGTSATLAGATSTSQQAVGSGTQGVSYAQGITGPQQGGTYFFRAVASSAAGTTTGEIMQFGPPIVTTNPATNIGFSSATLNGTVNPNSLATSWAFQYTVPSDTTFAQASVTDVLTLPAGATSVNVSANIVGNCSAIYRTVAVNELGATPGSTRQVTFAGCLRGTLPDSDP